MTTPQILGTQRSFGFGDRLGLATPGHIEAVRGSSFLPVFAQQSIREMERTDRTPAQVMECAVRAIQSSGYDGPWGADADHLQTPADLDGVTAAGFCFFTIDPSAHVHCDADEIPAEALSDRIAELDGVDAEATLDRYLNRRVTVDGAFEIRFDDRIQLLRATLKYGAALVHAGTMARAIEEKMGGRPFELELSIDETDTATSPREHLFLGLELQRLGIRVASLAPRFVGDFEKGVDYRGSLDEFESHYRQHAAIARHCGGYKLSIHSGSDKFAVYPLMGRISGEALHVKTAGTSYLEALRVVCRTDPGLFAEIVRFSRDRFETDRATYHISGRLDQVVAAPAAEEAETLYLEGDAGRQILHVTYGSVLTTGTTANGARFKDRLLETLDRHADLHAELVARHLGKHIELLES